MIQACAQELPEADATLVRGLLAGSPEAHLELYERFAPRLQRFAAMRLPNTPESAEDIAVQTLLLAGRKIHQFNPRKGTFLSWLYGIARQEIIRELRLQSRRKSIPSSAQVPIGNAAEEQAGPPLDQVAAARIDAQRQLSSLSQALSEVEMEVLILSCIDELSLREIGRIIGRSERAVHSLMHRARQKARERLGENEG